MERDEGGGPGAWTNQPCFLQLLQEAPSFPVLLHLTGVLSKKIPVTLRSEVLAQTDWKKWKT